MEIKQTLTISRQKSRFKTQKSWREPYLTSPNFSPLWKLKFLQVWTIRTNPDQNILLFKTYLDTLYTVQSGKLLELSSSFWSNSMIWPLTEKFVYKQKSAKLSLDSILRNNNTIWKVLTARGFFLRLQPSQNNFAVFSREIEVCQHSNKTVTTFFHEFFP